MNKVWLRVLWGIVGAMLILVGILCLCNPGITLAAFALIFGFSLLISGIVDIVIFARWNQFLFGAGWFLVDGILTILLSFFLFFHMGFTSLSMPFVFGMWTLFAGIDRLVFSFELQKFGVRGWGWITAVGIVLALIGFFAFFDPVFGTLTMTTLTGALLIVRGIAAVVQAIFAGRYLR